MAIDADEFQEILEEIDICLTQAYNGNLTNRPWAIECLDDAKTKLNDLIERMKQ